MVDTQPNKAVSIIECDMKVIYLFIIIFFVCVCVCVWGGGGSFVDTSNLL